MQNIARLITKPTSLNSLLLLLLLLLCEEETLNNNIIIIISGGCGSRKMWVFLNGSVSGSST